jgi:hypothetical protein
MRVLICFIVVILLLSSCEKAIERALDGQKVILLAPANNTVTTDTLQTFYWETMTGAATYQLQVVSPRFDSIARLIEDTIVNRNRFIVDMPQGNFQWRVRAFNNSSNSAYSDTFRVTIQ